MVRPLVLGEADVFLRIIVASVGIGLAALVYLSAPERRVHHWLAAFLVLDALNGLIAALWIGTNQGIIALPGVHDAAATRGFRTLAQLTYFALVPLYIGFVARVGPAPVTRAIRGPRTRRIWWVLAVLLPIDYFLLRHRYDAVVGAGGPGAFALALVEVVPMLLATGLGVAAMAQLRGRAAADSTARRRATHLLRAFLVASIAWWWILLDFALYYVVPAWFPAWYWPVRGIGFTVLVLAHYGLLFYGTLRGVLLHADQRRVRNVAAGAALIVLASAFFIATETVEGLMGGNSTIANLVSAGAVTLAFRPLHVAATKAILRTTRDPRAFATLDEAGRRVAFRDQLELALADERVEAGERRILDEVAASLGLDSDEAAALEAEVQRRLRR